MTKNVGLTDRVVRVLLGLLLLSFVYSGPETLWGWVGLIPLITGLFGTCPLYSALGWTTCENTRDG